MQKNNLPKNSPEKTKSAGECKTRQATLNPKPAPENSQGGQIMVHAEKRELCLPVPPPDMIAEYAKQYPEAPAKFFQWVEDEASHRRKLDDAMVQSQISDSKNGLIFGFIIVLACIGLAAWALALGHPWPASLLGMTSVGSLAAVFINGRVKK